MCCTNLDNFSIILEFMLQQIYCTISVSWYTPIVFIADTVDRCRNGIPQCMMVIRR